MLLTYETAKGTARFEARGRRGFSRYRITYSDNNGKSYAVGDSDASCLGLGYKAQEQVKVLYPAGDPAAGVVATFYHLWFWPLFVLLGPSSTSCPWRGGPGEGSRTTAWRPWAPRGRRRATGTCGAAGGGGKGAGPDEDH
jgi:hypothetical protein